MCKENDHIHIITLTQALSVFIQVEYMSCSDYGTIDTHTYSSRAQNPRSNFSTDLDTMISSIKKVGSGLLLHCLPCPLPGARHVQKAFCGFKMVIFYSSHFPCHKIFHVLLKGMLVVKNQNQKQTKLMGCSEGSIQREIHNYKHLHLKNRSQISKLTLYLKKVEK